MKINNRRIDKFNKLENNKSYIFFLKEKEYRLAKKIIAIVIFIYTVLSVQTVASQEQEKTRPYRIGTSLGYSFTGFREETDSNINRYLNTLTYLIDGIFEKGNFLHSFNLGFFTGESRTALEFEKKYNIPRYYSTRGYIEYALDYRIWGNETFPGFLGGAFRTDVYFTETLEIPRYTGIISIGVHATQKWIIDTENMLILSVSMPLLGYAIRSPYGGTDEYLQLYSIESTPLKIAGRGSFASLHNYWAVFANLTYHHKINALLSLYSGLGFELSHINVNRPRIDSILKINSGIAFHFRSKT